MAAGKSLRQFPSFSRRFRESAPFRLLVAGRGIASAAASSHDPSFSRDGLAGKPPVSFDAENPSFKEEKRQCQQAKSI
jgi:hypothetical protein